MKKKNERGESLMAFLSRAVRDSTLMTNLALNIRARTARIKKGWLRWYVLAALVFLWGGETWFCTNLFGPIGKMPRYESIRSVVTGGGRTQVSAASEGGRSLGAGSFRSAWDSLLAEPGVRGYWDSLLRQRPGLADTIRRLLQLDSVYGVK